MINGRQSPADPGLVFLGHLREIESTLRWKLCHPSVGVPLDFGTSGDSPEPKNDSRSPVGGPHPGGRFDGPGASGLSVSPLPLRAAKESANPGSARRESLSYQLGQAPLVPRLSDLTC